MVGEYGPWIYMIFCVVLCISPPFAKPWLTISLKCLLYPRTKKQTYKDSFKGYNVILHYILKTIFIHIGYPAFHFRPINSEQDINLTDFHYSLGQATENKNMLHILFTRRFFFFLVYYFRNILLSSPIVCFFL